MDLDPPPLIDVADDPELAAYLDDLVGVGGQLSPELVLAGYAESLFPMPIPQEFTQRTGGEHLLGWWRPQQRAIIPIDPIHVPHSVKPLLKKYEIRFDARFEDVVRRCTERREHQWIDEEMQRLYSELFTAGKAHSVEVYDVKSGEMVGGLFGITSGTLFAGESMFNALPNTAKIAMCGLRYELRRLNFTLLDSQWMTEYLRSLGAVAIPADEYQLRVIEALSSKPTGQFGERGNLILTPLMLSGT